MAFWNFKDAETETWPLTEGVQPVTPGPAKRLGVYMCIYPRGEAKPDCLSYLVHNHYLARRLITTDGYHTHEVPKGLLSKLFFVSQFAEGLDDLGEGLFFIGRLVKTWQILKSEKQLEPGKHYIKFYPAAGYLFPKKLFSLKAFKDYLGSFGNVAAALVIPISTLAIWDDPLVFAEAIGLSAGVVLFLYFLFREVSKFGR